MEQERISFEWNTGIPGLALFGRHTLNRAGSPMVAHTHPGLMEIVFLHRGVQQFRVGGQSYEIKGGEAFISQPDEPHSTGGTPRKPQSTTGFSWTCGRRGSCAWRPRRRPLFWRSWAA